MSPDPRASIDEVVSRFFAVFDNRPGHTPDAAVFCSLFAPGGVVATHKAREVVTSSPADFVRPRVELLASGRLLDFHEWETEAQTQILGSLAVRHSRYSKSGQLEGRPYSGSGTKFFQFALTSSAWRIVALSWIDDDAMAEPT